MHASIALVNKMKTAEKLDQRDQLLPIYTKVIERLENSEKEKFATSVDHAYTKKADLLLEDDQGQEALDAVNAAIQRFKKPGRDSQNLANFMFKKGELLEYMDREEEALLAYEQYLDRFDKDDNHK